MRRAINPHTTAYHQFRLRLLLAFLFGLLTTQLQADHNPHQSLIDSLRNDIRTKAFEESHAQRKALIRELINYNHVQEAEILIDSSILKCQELNDQTGQAQYKVLKAVCCRYQQSYDTAYTILFDCLEKLSGVEHRDSILQQIYNLFGVFLYDRGQIMAAFLKYNNASMVCPRS